MKGAFEQFEHSSLAFSRGHRAFAEVYLEFDFQEAEKWLSDYFEGEVNKPGLKK